MISKNFKLRFFWVPFFAAIISQAIACVFVHFRFFEQAAFWAFVTTIFMGIGFYLKQPVNAAIDEAVRYFSEAKQGKIGCGHTVGDLISAPGTVTKCGACLAERQNGITHLSA